MILCLLNINYYASFIAGFTGNALVMLLSLQVNVQEIRAYRWIISSQAAIELVACLLKVLTKFVSLT